MPIQERIAARKMSAMLPVPPSRANILAVSGSSLAACTMSWAIAPKDRPAMATPMVQPSRAPRWSRHARASGLRSRGDAADGPSRAGSTPAPWSRRTSSAATATSRTRISASGSSRTHHCSPANGRNRSAQPMGDSHDSQDSSAAESPMARSRNAAPRTAKAIPLAGRAYWVTWTVIAATPANTRPLRPQATTSATDPAAGRPMAMNASAVIATSTALTARTNSRPAASQAYLPTTPALTSSARPVSSSCRVCRVTRNMLIRPMRKTHGVTNCQAVAPP